MTDFDPTTPARPDGRWPHTSAMVHEAPTPRYWTPYQGYADALLYAGDVLEQQWAAMYPPHPAAFTTVAGRLVLRTPGPEGRE